MPPQLDCKFFEGKNISVMPSPDLVPLSRNGPFSENSVKSATPKLRVINYKPLFLPALFPFSK